MPDNHEPAALPDVKDTVAASAGGEEEVKDNAGTRSAVKFAVVGHGQSGNNLAKTFWQDAGYRKNMVSNTNSQDMAGTPVPGANRLIIGDVEGGAGKDPEVGRRLAEEAKEDIIACMRRSWGKQYDRALVCCSVSGGTGAGGFGVVVDAAEIASEHVRERRKDGKPVVGAILTLPTSGESAVAVRNALSTLKQAFELVEAGRLSPLILIDNSRFQQVSALNFYDKMNQKIVRQLARFNHVAALEGVDQFDRKDWDSLLASGVLTFGITAVMTAGDKWHSPDHISKAIRDNLGAGVLLNDVNLKDSTNAGCIMVGTEQTLESITQDCVEEAYKSINRQIHPSAVVHRGMFIDPKESDLLITTVFGGLKTPMAYLKKLEAMAK